MKYSFLLNGDIVGSTHGSQGSHDTSKFVKLNYLSSVRLAGFRNIRLILKSSVVDEYNNELVKTPISISNFLTILFFQARISYTEKTVYEFVKKLDTMPTNVVIVDSKLVEIYQIEDVVIEYNSVATMTEEAFLEMNLRFGDEILSTYDCADVVNRIDDFLKEFEGITDV